VTYKVLIVDDSKLARMGVLKALKALHPDWQSVEAVNAEDAFARVKESQPDFVLLDYNMPGKDGITLAAELREFDSGLNVAVISANQQIEVINRAQAAGAVFLAKPLTEKALADFLDIAAQQPGRTRK
jgi:YesN/AraC family two-component response regulator